jgi:hypothetical protein
MIMTMLMIIIMILIITIIITINVCNISDYLSQACLAESRVHSWAGRLGLELGRSTSSLLSVAESPTLHIFAH